MNRYKGRSGAKAIERENPNIVEMPVPDGGLGKRLDAMHLFHLQLGIKAAHGEGRYEEGRHYIRWCFADPQHARSFQALFGGELIVRPDAHLAPSRRR